MTAPVLPAETNPCAMPSRTRREATRRELSRLARTARAALILHGDLLGGVDHLDRQAAVVVVLLQLPPQNLLPPDQDDPDLPTSWPPRRPPRTSAFGALSPPIASTAMVTMWGGWLLLLDFHYFAAFVLSAVRAHAMRQLRFMTVGAFGHPGSFQRIVRAAILGAARGVASFRIRHFVTSKSLPRNRGAFKVFSGPSDLVERPTGYRRGLPCSRRAFHCGCCRTWTDPFAILAADSLHGHDQQDLLA